MNVSVNEPLKVVTVTLSERNVKALYHKLTMDSSARTLVRSCGGYILTVEVEGDEEHYGERTPGSMHPETEDFIADN